MKKLLFLLIIPIYMVASSIDVYTYHNHAPFMVKDGKGKTEKLVKFLNKEAKGEFTFNLKVVPRKRLNYIIKDWVNDKCLGGGCKNNWVILWVNHKWGFGKNSLKNFNWTPLLADSNAIISGKTSVNYKDPSSLIGKTLAGIGGHKYLGIDDLVKEGKIKRINGNSETENLLKVLAGRVDATLLPESSFLYYQESEPNFKNLKMEDVRHQKYMRNIMTPVTNKNLITFLEGLNLDKGIK